MYFSNINFLTITIFLGLFLLVLFLYIKIVINNKKIIKIGFTFLFISFLLCILSILGPKGDIKKDYIIGNNISFLLDVSQSMDIQLKGTNKTKLELSKEIIKNYVNKNKNNNYSLTIFSGDALNIIPFVSDTGIFQSFLYGVSKNNLSKLGTDILNAFKILFLNYKGRETGVIILITDGGEEEINNLNNIKKILKEKNIKLIIIGIGNIKGNYIPIGFDNMGKVLYKYHNSKKVIISLSDNILKNLSKELKGKYIRVIDRESLEKLENNLSKYIFKISLQQTYNKREDLTEFFIFIAFLFFMLYCTTLFIYKSGLFLGKKD